LLLPQNLWQFFQNKKNATNCFLLAIANGNAETTDPKTLIILSEKTIT
jgi:hypothetical protein